VRQHVLGVVVNNVIYCFVANLTGFPARQEFRKSVKISQSCLHNGVVHVFETQCICLFVLLVNDLCFHFHNENLFHVSFQMDLIRLLFCQIVSMQENFSLLKMCISLAETSPLFDTTYYSAPYFR